MVKSTCRSSGINDMLISFNEAIRFDAGEFARLLKSLSQQAENK